MPIHIKQPYFIVALMNGSFIIRSSSLIFCSIERIVYLTRTCSKAVHSSGPLTFCFYVSQEGWEKESTEKANGIGRELHSVKRLFADRCMQNTLEVLGVQDHRSRDVRISKNGWRIKLPFAAILRSSCGLENIEQTFVHQSFFILFWLYLKLYIRRR